MGSWVIFIGKIVAVSEIWHDSTGDRRCGKPLKQGTHEILTPCFSYRVQRLSSLCEHSPPISARVLKQEKPSEKYA